jgi:hypothetical protein
MDIRGKHTFSLIFLIFFCCYVISPICYVDNRLHHTGEILNKANFDIKRIGVVWEFLISKLFSKENSEDSRPNVRFLIKKARAVLSSNSIEKISFAKYLLSFAVTFTNPEGSYASTDKLSSSSPDAGYILTFSGLSPPLLS